MANGFLTSAPGSRHGGNNGESGALMGQRFTAPGTGLIALSRIGVWAYTVGGGTLRLAVFTHDSVNNRPQDMVPDSESATLSSPAAWTDVYHTYTQKPLLNGGKEYWLVAMSADGADAVYDYASGSGLSFVYGGAPGTFPTWPTESEWHAYNLFTDRDSGLYAVYAAAETGLTLYWNGSGASIGANDYAMPGTTVQNYHGATYDAAAAIIGSLGGNHDQTTDAQTRFLNTNNFLITPEEGCFAAWVRWVSYGSPLYSQDANSWPECVSAGLNAAGAIRFNFKEGTGDQNGIVTSDGVASLNTRYFIILRWRSAGPYRRLEVYDFDLQQVAYVETSASWVLPLNIGGRVTIGQSDGMADSHVDNVFLSRKWDEPVLANAKIDAYSAYTYGGSGPLWAGVAGRQTRHTVRTG